MAASLSHREADLESNPPSQGNGPIPLYYRECFSLSFSISLQRDPGSGTVVRDLEVPSVFSIGQQLDNFLFKCFIYELCVRNVFVGPM